jgi:hypothetical protein
VASNSLNEQFPAEIWPLKPGHALAGTEFSVAGSIPTSASSLFVGICEENGEKMAEFQ